MVGYSILAPADPLHLTNQIVPDERHILLVERPERMLGCSCPSNPLSPRLAPACPFIPRRPVGFRRYPPYQAGTRTPWLLSTWSRLAGWPCA